MSKRSIENLFIWKQAREVVNLVYLMMKECKDYSFRDQIQRAAVSIMKITSQKDLTPAQMQDMQVFSI